MNYGHPLQFGTFITPRSASPEAVTALTVRSEELGYDLVTFQDHPYQPAHLDTWTLLSWVAGQTSRIHLAANVLNLPLRQPAVLARSAASLDQLSGGRLELSLGAGAFWEGITAMGGPRRSPGEAVAALEEAIQVMRGILDAASSTPFSFTGRHYRLESALRGPAPAHNIPIWIGARKERMLRLIGRQADGWLVTRGYLQPGEFQAGNQIIDQAARQAGRDPREIRRLVNISGTFSSVSEGFLQGPPQKWVDDLLPIVVEQGAGTLILMTDDAETMEQFAREVIPALRAAVHAVIPGLSTARLPRSSFALSRRSPGIDYDAVPESLIDSVIEPGDAAYALVKSTYLRGGAPGIVFQVKNVRQVIDALAFARQHTHLPLSIRSGGHGISGRSTNRGGIVIDLSHLDTIEVLDRATRRVRSGPGARWMEVAQTLAPYGWALTSGDYGGVGVGGLATAGGIGFLARAHGLTIDHLRAVEMVLADGSVVRASDDENPDLFWAVRGAGANFGIVTSFEFEADPVGNVGWATFLYDAGDTAGLLERWGRAVESSPRDLTSFLVMGPPRRGQPAVAQAMTMVNSSDPDLILNRLQPLAQAAPLYDYTAVITSYASVITNAQDVPHSGVGEPAARSGLVEHITPGFAAAAAELLRSGAVYFFQIRSVGGAVSDIAPDATAYAHRSANFHVTAFGANRERLNAAWDQLRAHFNGLYLAFETDQRPERLLDAFPPATLTRLRLLKQRYDPDNLFRDNFNLQPQESVQVLRAQSK